MGQARIKCHCGNEKLVLTGYNGEHGWYECDCGCAWLYLDAGKGVVIVNKTNSCSKVSPRNSAILQHYPSGDVFESRYVQQ